MSAIDQARRGMRVVDILGQQIGTVDQVRRGDGGPVTTHGRGGLPGGLARALGSVPNVHPQTAARMLRAGYVRIDRRGVLSRHGYAGADQIRDVAGDTVFLSVSADQVLTG